jgi:flagella basal body P-ring formation protein FlgA
MKRSTLPCLRLACAVFSAVFTAGLRAGDQPATAPFSRDQLVALLSRDLAAHYNLEGDLDLELVRPWSPPDRLAAHWEVSVLDYPAVAAASMLLRCRVRADGATVTDTTLVLHAALWRDAWAAREPLAVGAAFDSSVLDTRRVDLFRERDVLPAAVGDRSYAFARAVPAGRLLTWHDISRRPLVHKGELVEVRATEGLLIVTMKALALENGSQGDTVTVRNPESRRDFPAVVIDENHVQVRF